MKRTDSERLVTEMLAGEGLSELRTSALNQGVAYLRRRKHRRRITQAGLCACLLFVALWGLVTAGIQKKLPKEDHRFASEKPAQKVTPRDSGIEWIDDDELLALFPNRPVALIGQPGKQQLVFLDADSAPVKDDY
jgi:hypothetical protein